MPTPKEVIEAWVAAFNARDAAAAVALYHEDATNEQVPVREPRVGHVAIFADLAAFFHAFPDSYTHIEHLFQDGEWAILEWSGGGTWRGAFADMAPNGRTFTLRGCGFFHVTVRKDCVPARLLGQGDVVWPTRYPAGPLTLPACSRRENPLAGEDRSAGHFLLLPCARSSTISPCLSRGWVTATRRHSC